MKSTPTGETTGDARFDFDAIAAVWSRAAEVLAPLTPILIDRLGPLRAGSTVLDVACGTGEPGLSIAGAHSGVQLVGVDTAPAMIERARVEAGEREGVQARFEVMTMEALDLESESVDAVVSRMGLLGVPGSTVAAAREAFRVLSAGGWLTFATWDGTAGNPLGRAAVEACRHVAGAGAPDFGWQDELADGRRERWLREAGFSEVVSEQVSWTYSLPDADALWERASEIGPLRNAFAELDQSAQHSARDHLETAMAPWRYPDGTYLVVVAGRVFSAVKPQ